MKRQSGPLPGLTRQREFCSPHPTSCKKKAESNPNDRRWRKQRLQPAARHEGYGVWRLFLKWDTSNRYKRYQPSSGLERKPITKHDFHIALVLLVLITAGILGYQSLNAESGSTSNKCTLVLYFLSFDGCNSSDNIEILPPPFLDEHQYENISPNEIGLFETENPIEEDGRSLRRLGWNENIPDAIIPSEPDSMFDVEPDK